MAQEPVQIQNYLKNVNFPARRDKIIEEAKKNNAPQDVMNSLQRLPDREFRNANHVNEELTSVQTSGGKMGGGGGGGGTGGGGGGRSESRR